MSARRDSDPTTSPPPRPANFIRGLIDADLASGKYAERRWSGRPGPAAAHQDAPRDPARIRTRFPPEPNGYLHIGHAKSILLNFGLAEDYAGACHLRFDDTNPTKEEQEYVDSIIESVRWLGCDWGTHRFFASDYFDTLCAFAELFIQHGDAYVDSLSAEEIRRLRGTLTEPGQPSPYRERPPEESLALFRRMRSGEYPDGAHVLRLRIDMRSPNINLRDPAIYRIRHAHHHRTGDRWCVYPLYDYTHCISDALENITHSICTLEFEDHRPLYDWVLERLVAYGALADPRPQQIEFARLNLTYVVLSKRKLIQLVDEGRVAGWDDPRMPTLAGARRRGYTPGGFRLFTERIGVAKADSWIDYGVLEDAMREDLNAHAERRIAVLDPVKLVIDNFPADAEEPCSAPNHPQRPDLGKRTVPFTRELWIERDDYMDAPPKGYFRLSPGAEVRLRYAYVVKCVGVERDDEGRVTVVHCTFDPATKSGSAGAEAKKVKGNIHWLSARHARAAEVRIYDRLFRAPVPGTTKGQEPARRNSADEDGHAQADDALAGRDWLDDLNPESIRSVQAWIEPGLAQAEPESRFQFERLGYFCADRRDMRADAPVFNRTVTLRDTWAKGA